MVQGVLADGRHGASEVVGRHSCVNVARDWEKRQNAFFSLFPEGYALTSHPANGRFKTRASGPCTNYFAVTSNLDNTLYQTWLYSEETFWPARGRCIASRRIPAVGGTRTNAATTDNGNCSPPPHLIYLFTYLFVKTIPCGVSNPAKTECTLHKRKRCGCAPDTSNVKGTHFVFLFEHQE